MSEGQCEMKILRIRFCLLLQAASLWLIMFVMTPRPVANLLTGGRGYGGASGPNSAFAQSNFSTVGFCPQAENEHLFPACVSGLASVLREGLMGVELPSALLLLPGSGVR